jgi:hypothetical protein
MMKDDELEAWDRFAAAALGGAMTENSSSWSNAAIHAARAADKLLDLRREKIAEASKNVSKP